MSNPARALVAVVLLIVGFALGYLVARERTALPRPVRPSTEAETALWIEQKGELRGILMERNPMSRAIALSAKLGEYGPEAVPAVATLLQAGAFGLGSTEAALLTRFWAMHDPAAAADWALKHSAPVGVRPIVAETALEVYAMQDPQGARPLLELFAAAVSDPMVEAAQSAFVRGWFQSGEPGLEAVIKGLGPEGPQGRLLTVLAQEIVHRDGVEALIAWLDAFPDDDSRYKRDAFRAAAPEIAKADLARAMTWCEQHCEKGYGEHVRALIARAWAREDGPAAMAWVRTAPAGAERDRAVWATFSHWRQTDPVGTLAWVDSVGLEGAGPWLYPVVDRIALWKSWNHPLEAYQWAQMIQDEDRRERALITIAHRHREVDPEGADEVLATLPLSEEARAKASVLPKGYKGRGKKAVPEAFLED